MIKTMVAVFTEVSLLCFVALANLRTGRMSQRKHAMIGWLGKGRVKMREEWMVVVMMPISQEMPTMARQACQLMGGEVQGPADGGIISIGHGHEQAAL